MDEEEDDDPINLVFIRRRRRRRTGMRMSLPSSWSPPRMRMRRHPVGRRGPGLRRRGKKKKKLACGRMEQTS
jgi:hypothetical protein